MVRIIVAVLFFTITPAAFSQEVPSLAGVRTFEEYFRTECPETLETECLRLWTLARSKAHPTLAGGAAVAPPAVDTGGVSLSVPSRSLPPGRSTSGVAVVPPSKTNESIDRLLCEKYGDCAALKKRQKKNRERGNK